jgi:DNA polymerase I-like protein with 3'-5' exonuclease and polymerase domains
MQLRGLINYILKSKELIGQNFHFDMQYFYRYFFCFPQPKHDTMIAQRVLWPGTPLSLYYIASMYCRHYVYWKDEGKTWEEGVDEGQLWTYNCEDAVRTYEAAAVQERLIEQFGFRAQMQEQMEIAQMGTEMMNRGIAIDEKARAKMTLEVMDDMFLLEEKLASIIPPAIAVRLMGKTASSPWYTSPAQQARFFYEILGLSPIYDPDTKAVTCDDAALEKIKIAEPILSQVCDWLQEERTLGIFLKNFLLKRLDFDRRMRCSFKPTPNTFRWASSENAFGSGTNLQNIPKGDTD